LKPEQRRRADRPAAEPILGSDAEAPLKRPYVVA